MWSDAADTGYGMGSPGSGPNSSLQAILRGMTETRQTLTDLLTRDMYFKKRLGEKMGKGPKKDAGHNLNPRPLSPVADKSNLFSKRSEAENPIDRRNRAIADLSCHSRSNGMYNSQSCESSYSHQGAKGAGKGSMQYEGDEFRMALMSLAGLRYVVVSVTRFRAHMHFNARSFSLGQVIFGC
jgi:hypothetical protein